MTGDTREDRIIGAASAAVEEAKRALRVHGADNTIDAPDKSDAYRLVILVEEVGEVAKELTYDHFGVSIEPIDRHRGATAEMEYDSFTGTWLTPAGESRKLLVDDLSDETLAHYGYRRVTREQRLRKELIQAAAMALTWAAMLP